MNIKGSLILRVTSILMIVAGALDLLLTVIGFMGSMVISSLISGLFILFVLAAIFSLLGAILQLVAGIVGLKNYNNPAKAKVCIVLGIAVAAFALLSNLIAIGNGTDFNFVTLLSGLLLPAVYVGGAFMNKSDI